MYLDETWANAHDGKDRAWVEKDTTCKQGTIGGIEFVEILNLFLIKKIFFIENHLEKENGL